jgi:hypothetical protein
MANTEWIDDEFFRKSRRHKAPSRGRCRPNDVVHGFSSRGDALAKIFGALNSQMAGVPQEGRWKMAAGNAIDFFRLDPIETLGARLEAGVRKH